MPQVAIALYDQIRVPFWVSQDYGWDFRSQVNLPMLRQALKSLIFVADNPKQFPKADHAAVCERIDQLHEFLCVDMLDLETLGIR